MGPGTPDASGWNARRRPAASRRSPDADPLAIVGLPVRVRRTGRRDGRVGCSAAVARLRRTATGDERPLRRRQASASSPPGLVGWPAGRRAAGRLRFVLRRRPRRAEGRRSGSGAVRFPASSDPRSSFAASERDLLERAALAACRPVRRRWSSERPARVGRRNACPAAAPAAATAPVRLRTRGPHRGQDEASHADEARRCGRSAAARRCWRPSTRRAGGFAPSSALPPAPAASSAACGDGRGEEGRQGRRGSRPSGSSDGSSGGSWRRLSPEFALAGESARPFAAAACEVESPSSTPAKAEPSLTAERQAGAGWMAAGPEPRDRKARRDGGHGAPPAARRGSRSA